MALLCCDKDKFDLGEGPALMTAVNNGIKDLVRRKFSESGLPWCDFVFGASDAAISTEALLEIDRKILASGYRYAASAVISAIEQPDAYAPIAGMTEKAQYSFEHPAAKVGPVDAQGRQERGQGDNVVQHPANLVGTARYFRTVQDVIACLGSGVPAHTIAIIDDSGGTLTAPILEQFAAVICAGGTVRSHLGILTREYGIPCFMNSRISGIFDGDRIEMEISQRAKTLEDYQQGREMSARVWKLAP